MRRVVRAVSSPVPAVAATARGFAVTAPLREARKVMKREFSEDVLATDYEQQAFESLRKMQASTTYPGAIRAATPGDTFTYVGRETVLRPGERHYWRPVTDDPAVRRFVSVRCRFKEAVNVGPRFETKLHVVRVRVREDCTIRHVIDEVTLASDSPFVAQGPFALAATANGKALDPESLLSEALPHRAGSTDVTLDAIEEATDHVWHQSETRPKNWDTDEMAPGDLEKSPHAEYQDPGHRWGHARPPAMAKYGATDVAHLMSFRDPQRGNAQFRPNKKDSHHPALRY